MSLQLDLIMRSTKKKVVELKNDFTPIAGWIDELERI